MKPSRRGFFGLAAGAAAAGPGIARNVAMQTADTLPWKVPHLATNNVGQTFTPAGDWKAERLKEMHERLVDLTTGRPDRLRDARRNVSRLDADLETNRSLSLTTKVRIQAERDVDRETAGSRSYIMKAIDALLKPKGGL